MTNFNQFEDTLLTIGNQNSNLLWHSTSDDYNLSSSVTENFVGSGIGSLRPENTDINNLYNFEEIELASNQESVLSIKEVKNQLKNQIKESFDSLVDSVTGLVLEQDSLLNSRGARIEVKNQIEESFDSLVDDLTGLASKQQSLFPSKKAERWFNNRVQKSFDSLANKLTDLAIEEEIVFPSQRIEKWFNNQVEKSLDSFADNLASLEEDERVHTASFDFVSGKTGSDGKFYDNVRWENPNRITYSFGNILNGNLIGITNNQITSAIEEALDLWADFAPLTFVEVTNNANITFGNVFIDGSLGTVGNTSTTWHGSFFTDANINFDTAEAWQIGSTGSSGIDFLEVAVHEIGHSLGLSHPDEYGQTTNAVMNSMVDGTNTPNYTGLTQAFLYADDIRGIIDIYGES